MRKYMPPLVLFVLSAFASCGQKTFDEKMQSLYQNTVPLIQAEDLKPRLADVVLLDIRSQEEYEVSHLPHAQLVDYDGFKVKKLKGIPKDEEIIVYCSVGYRSERVGEKLQEAGYTNVRNLYGGIFDWKNKDHEVVGMNEKPTDSVHTYNKSWGKWLYKGTKVQ